VSPRANWKGFLKVGELSSAVSLYTAASSSERIAFHTINRATGHRVRRQFVDSETGEPVEREDQVKGYEVSSGDYVMINPDDVAAAVPESDKTLEVEAFISCGQVDDVFFDKPYYLAPSDKSAEEAFGLIREGMRKKEVVALARTVLFRRVQTLLIRAYEKGLIATTLNFDYEVRPAREGFAEVPDLKIKGEMLELAAHIIKTKMGEFDPTKFDDRYEAALAELVKAKLQGRKIEAPRPPKTEKVVDLMEALRQSAGQAKPSVKKAAKAKTAAKRSRPASSPKIRPEAKRKAG
jgi:DNA end-binding protein Ku